MKLKAILTSTLIVVSFCSSAQYNKLAYNLRYSVFAYQKPSSYFPVDYYRTEDFAKKRNIRSMSITSEEVKKNGKVKKSKYWHKYAINSDGEVTQVEGGKIGKPSAYSYDYLTGNKNRKEILSRDKNGKLKEKKVMIQSFENGYAKQLYIINSKGDTASKTILNGIDTLTLQKSDYYYAKGKLKYKWTTEYFQNKSIKRSTFYNGKEKEKYVWDYQCNEEGVEIKKHKDTSTVCVSREYDQDSILTTISHTVNSKGEILKTIRKMNKKNRIIAYTRTKGTNDVLISKYTYNYASDNTTNKSSHANYYKKGIITSETYKEYGDDSTLSLNKTLNYKKGKLVSETIASYIYDAKARPIKKTIKDSVNGTQKISHISYGKT